MIKLQQKAQSPEGAHTDEHLMELIQAGNYEGLQILHVRYGVILKAVSMKVLHNAADAEDLTQEVFVEIWNSATGYDPLKGRPLAWIATLTRRRSIDRLRKRDTYCRLEKRFAEETISHVDGWPHVHEDMAQNERSAYLQSALARLPALQRDAIRLAYYSQMTQREVAQHIGIALGTIKTRLELGLEKLAGFLGGFEDLLLDSKSPACA